jgi:hypothetical protein
MVELSLDTNQEKLVEIALDKQFARICPLDGEDIWAGFSREAREICESSDLMKVDKKD